MKNLSVVMKWIIVDAYKLFTEWRSRLEKNTVVSPVTELVRIGVEESRTWKGGMELRWNGELD